MEANANDWSRYRLHVWSKKRSFIFAAETDAEFKQWIQGCKEFLNAKFTDEQLTNKKNAFLVCKIETIGMEIYLTIIFFLFQHIRSMLEKQDLLQIQHYTHLRAVLDRSMVLGAPKSDKYKQGYVSVQAKNGKWRDQYIILSSKYIVGHNLKNKVITSFPFLFANTIFTEKSNLVYQFPF